MLRKRTVRISEYNEVFVFVRDRENEWNELREAEERGARMEKAVEQR